MTFGEAYTWQIMEEAKLSWLRYNIPWISRKKKAQQRQKIENIKQIVDILWREMQRKKDD